jgi:hypothetical protein
MQVSPKVSLFVAGLAGAFCSLSFLALAQQPDPNAGKQLIKSAERDANNYLVMPLPKPGVIDGKPENPGQFAARVLRFRNDMLKNLRSDLPLGQAEQLMVDNYFNGFEFRVLTQTTPEDLEQLPERRFDLFKRYILQVKNAENHQHLIDLTMAMMQQIVMDEFHPVVRYNAMLIIGDLNEQEVQRVGATPQPPEPYAAALPFMVERVTDQNTPDTIRVAALVGILRHLEWEPFRNPSHPIPAGVRTQLVNTLIALAEMKDPPANRTAEGQMWLRRRAVECLGYAGAVTATPNIITPVEKILKDNTEPLNMRCIAAKALGTMNIPQGHKLEALDLTRTLGNLAAASVKTEFDRLEKIDKTAEEHAKVYAGSTGVPGQSGGYPGGPGGEGMARPRFQGEGIGLQPGAANQQFEPDPKEYRLDPVRRRIRYQLYCVQTALGYPLDKASAAPSPTRKGAHRITNPANPTEKKSVEEVLTAVNKLVDVIEKNKIDLVQLKTDLKNEAKALEGVIAKATPAPVAAPDPAAAPVKAGDPAAPARPAAAAAAEEDLLGGAAPKK